jgi:hypothetical protein
METKDAFDYVIDVTIAFENPYCGLNFKIKK